MTCLHICNDYKGSKVHKNLYERLDELHLRQIIFYPKRNYVQRGEEKKLDFIENSSMVVGSDKFRIYHRILFRLKIRSLFRDLEKRVNLKSIDIVHATTLFSDGAIALKIFKDHNIPYIVTVRMTDINVFFKYRPDLISLGHEILRHAQKIIFISGMLKNRFYDHEVIQKTKKEYLPKSEVINNGIDNFWLSNISNKKRDQPHKILFVGRFTKLKNISKLISAYLQLRKTSNNLELNLVGMGGSQERQIKSRADECKDIKFHGPIFDKKKLLKMYRANHIFAMPSINETFGLVYIEALSQGLPLLYTKGDGFYGVINKKIGEAISPISVDSIYKGLETIINDYNSYEIDKVDFDEFNWIKIAKRYQKLYQSIL